MPPFLAASRTTPEHTATIRHEDESDENEQAIFETDHQRTCACTVHRLGWVTFKTLVTEG